ALPWRSLSSRCPPFEILFADRPHARVLNVDTSAAEAIEGVHLVLTSADVPNNSYGLVIPDQPVLVGPSSQPGADVVRTTMDNVAVVVAETEAIAEKALRLIDVQYADLPAVFDPFEAMQASAPQLHPNTPDNVLAHYEVRRGDMDAGWQAADVVVEGTYTTTWQEHAYLQPEAGLGYIDEEGRVTVEVAGQDAHEDRRQLAHALALPEERIRIIYRAIGGAFGGREDMSVQILLAMAALRLDRPVKALWSREESIKGHHKRHPIIVKARLGARSDGTLVAMEAEIVGDAGAYASTSTKVLANACLLSLGPYRCPNVSIDTYTVYTNNIPCGAFRGFGGPQAALAAEGQMNKLAEALGIDPVELRLKNILREGDTLHVGTPLPAGVKIGETLQACADARSALPEEPGKRYGTGIAVGYKNVGFSFGYPERCSALVELHGGAAIERVVVRHAAAEVGQGAHTVIAQLAADAVGVPVEKIELDMSDTATSGDAGSASASRMTFMAGNAIRGAAEQALERWQDEDRPAVGEHTYRPPATTLYEPKTGKSEPNFSYGYAAVAVIVEVDPATGFITVHDVICSIDAGKAVNPQQVEGQVEGCIAQAHGYALMENFQMSEGRVQTAHLSTYHIPTVLDMPARTRTVICEFPDPLGPNGVRGVGEMPFMAYPAAVAAAVANATGVWIDALPLTPDRVLRALHEAADAVR
ncbi:MAG: xanthine dehydrogenase family protein molybdopterin-binding subunit, partial [Anaerolineae bacterium]